MSCTRSSPSCESRSRLTASYSYRPCCALVVDLMCHSRIGTPSDLATSSASIVLPVPGSPFTSSGRCSVIAALTASVRSSVETYDGEPLKRKITRQELAELAYKSSPLGRRPPQTSLRFPRQGDFPPGRKTRLTLSRWPEHCWRTCRRYSR